MRHSNKVISFELYSGKDPRTIPTYTIAEAAQYTNVPVRTLQSWIAGRTIGQDKSSKTFKPVIVRPRKDLPMLSFTNLVEAHVLNALRRNHNIPMHKIRAALTYVESQFNSKHPLAEQDFETDGVNLFMERFGEFINVSQHGQLAMRDLLKSHLSRIDRDEAGFARRLYPFTRTFHNTAAKSQRLQEPSFVVIDPFVSFGKPVLRGTGIPTAAIAERYKAGESIQALASDYDRENTEIEEAIRCELQAA